MRPTPYDFLLEYFIADKQRPPCLFIIKPEMKTTKKELHQNDGNSFHKSLETRIIL